MDDAQRFVTYANIDRIFSRLVFEPDAQRRSIDADILISEENRFASLSEQLEMTRDVLRRFDGVITKQRKHIEGAQDDRQREIAEILLRTLRDTRSLFENREHILRDELDNGKL